MIGQSKAASVELSFRPTPTLVTVVRGFVSEFYERATLDHDLADRLALVTHELLENAIKYSSDGEATLTLHVDSDLDSVSVCTRNLATRSRIAEVKAAFLALSSAPDADDFYAEAIRRTAVRKSGSGGLGLARIWAEADMRLRLSVRGDRVEIHARGKLSGGEP